MTAPTPQARALDVERFAALTRVYGHQAAAILPQLCICVVGIGGVGSWAAEALARSAVGKIVLIDADDIAEGNTNRQIHAGSSTFQLSKVEAMKTRILDINPHCEVVAIDDMLVENNLEKYIDKNYDLSLIHI